MMFEKAKVRGLPRGKLTVLAALIYGLLVFIQLKNRTVIYRHFVSVVIMSHRLYLSQKKKTPVRYLRQGKN
jgi:hypothetical protein